jgi:enediyne polyketide synthase
VAALVTRPGIVEVALRSEETAFQVNHFRAVCRTVTHAPHTLDQTLPLPDLNEHTSYLPLIPERDLYGSILFHKGRFRRLRAYLNLEATSCLAEISQDGKAEWFGQYLPSSLALGDPAARDAAIHAIQACIPHATLLPVGADRVEIAGAQVSGPIFVSARERSRDGNTFTYDLELSGADGRVMERWHGLRLRKVSNTIIPDHWPEHLLGPYIERRVAELIPGSEVTAAVGRGRGLERRSRADEIIRRALRREAALVRGAAGRPELVTNDTVVVSASHAGVLTLAVTGPGPVSCDIEPVTMRRDSVWKDLLGPERFRLAEVISEEMSEEPCAAATRVWAANECLKKAGIMVSAPLVLSSTAGDGWALLSSGSLTIATLITSVRGVEWKLAVGVLARRNDASL